MRIIVTVWWWLCFAMYVGLVVSFLVMPEKAAGWLYVAPASPHAVVELNAFYIGNMTLVALLMVRWRKSPQRWLGLLATLNTLVLATRCFLLIQYPDTVDSRMVGYLTGEAVLATVSWFLRYRNPIGSQI